MDIRVLGPVEITGERGAVRFPGRKQRRLLAALLVDPGATLTADALLDAIWPESRPPSASHALQVYVSQLRKLLADGIEIERHGGGYSLQLDPHSLDAVRFEQLLSEGSAVRRDGDPQLALALLDSALSLWRGPAYGELAYEDFARAEAERLEDLRTVAEEERFEAMLALGRQDQAIGALHAHVSEHPIRERPRRLLMLALYRAGRQSEALEVYRSFRRLLSDELGLEPSVELRELEAAILRQDETLAAPAPTEPDAAPPRAPVPPARERRHGRRTFAAVAAAVVVGVAGVTVAALALSAGGTARSAFKFPRLSAAAIDPTTGRVVKVVRLQDPPVAAVAVGRSLWIASFTDRTLTRLDDRTGAVLQTIGLPSHPVALAFGDGRIWIASGDRTHSLTAVDVRSGEIVLSRPLHQPGLGRFSSQGWGAHGIAFGNGSVWVTVGLSDLVRLSPEGVVEQTVAVGPAPTAVTAGDGGVWAEVTGPDQLVEIDPSGDSVAARLSVGNLAMGNFDQQPYLICTLAVSGQTVWAPAVGESSTISSGVWRIDGIDDLVSAVIRPGGTPCAVSLGHAKVWVANPGAFGVDEIDPRSNALVRRITLGAQPDAIASAPQHVWIVSG